MAAFDTPLNDPSLYALTVMPTTISSSPLLTSPALSSPKTSTSKLPPSSNSVPLGGPGPTDLLVGTPVPILHLIARLSPFIRLFTALIRLLTWSHPSVLAPWLLLFVWWGICLGGDYVARYGLNALGILILATGWLRRTGQRSNGAKGKVPVEILSRTPDKLDPTKLLQVIEDSRDLEAAIDQLMTSLEPLLSIITWRDPESAREAVSYLLTSYPAVLILTYLIPMKFTFLTFGTLLLLYNAPWFAILRRALWNSLVIRFLIRFTFSLLAGGRGLKRQFRRGKAGVRLFGGKTFVQAATKEGEEHGSDIHFLFTVFENQRWWIGLDWTQALLPNERPSWSDAHHAPVSPPTAFLLPVPTTTYTPSPTRSDPNSSLKRTTEWRWLDPEWTIKMSSAADRRLSETSNESSAKLRRSLSLTRHQSKASVDANTELAVGEEEDEVLGSNWDTDENGWQYGDNAWQKLSAKGKIGRYTRRRAWQRRATAVERVEKVSKPPSDSSKKLQ